MGTIRAFIAIEIPREIQEAIATGIAPLKSSAGKSAVRWVATENIHLTLKFLGDVSVTNLENLKQALRVEADQYPRFEIHVGGLGCFPNPRKPRVIWIGIQGPATLVSLQRGVDMATAKLGYMGEDRPFSPHLTIGRVREHASPGDLAQLRTGLEALKVGMVGVAPVSHITLFKSDLNPGGAEYTRLFDFPLSA